MTSKKNDAYIKAMKKRDFSSTTNPTRHVPEDAGRVITERERIEKALLQLFEDLSVNDQAGGWVPMQLNGVDDMKKLVDWIMTYAKDDWYDGYRQGYAKAQELDAVMIDSLVEQKRDFKVPDWQTMDGSGVIEAVPVSEIRKAAEALRGKK